MLEILSRDRLLLQSLLADEAAYVESGAIASNEAGSWLGNLSRRAGVDSIYIKRRIVVSLCSFVACVLLGQTFIGLAIALVFLAWGYRGLLSRVSKRRDSLDKEFPTLLTSLASSVRAGLDPLAALIKAKDSFDSKSAVGIELEKFARAAAAGADEEELIDSFGRTIDHPDLPLFRSCLRLSRKHGSSLAEPLHRVVRVTRQRQSFKRKVRAALAMHRLSAIGITLSALFIAALQVIMNWKGAKEAMAHPTGSKLIVGGVLLIVTGTVWLMAMGRSSSE